jgi:RNA polymerase sigma-70 factor (ECF subfamily)
MSTSKWDSSLSLEDEQLPQLVKDILSNRNELYRFCSWRVRSCPNSTTLAEDLVQQTMIKAIRNQHSYRGQAKLSVWLCAIAKNLCIDFYRRSNNHRLSKMETIDDVEDISYSDDSKRILYECLLHLPANLRVPLTLRLQDWSESEIAQQLHLCLGTAKSRIHRGKVMLIGLCRKSIEARSMRRGVAMSTATNVVPHRFYPEGSKILVISSEVDDAMRGTLHSIAEFRDPAQIYGKADVPENIGAVCLMTRGMSDPTRKRILSVANLVVDIQRIHQDSTIGTLRERVNGIARLIRTANAAGHENGNGNGANNNGLREPPAQLKPAGSTLEEAGGTPNPPQRQVPKSTRELVQFYGNLDAKSPSAEFERLRGLASTEFGLQFTSGAIGQQFYQAKSKRGGQQPAPRPPVQEIPSVHNLAGRAANLLEVIQRMSASSVEQFAALKQSVETLHRDAAVLERNYNTILEERENIRAEREQMREDRKALEDIRKRLGMSR